MRNVTPKKRKILIVLLVSMVSVACGVDKLGPSQCYMEEKNVLKYQEDSYNDDMTNIVDADGNGQSLEACLLRRQRTLDYIELLNQIRFTAEFACSQEEVDMLYEEVNERKEQLNEDMESTWNRCEEIYGSGG